MNKNAFITLAILIALCLPFTYGGCGGGGGSSDDGQVWVEESFSHEVAVDTHDRILIQTMGGSIEITGSPTANSVTVEGERRVGSKTKEDAEKHLELLEVEVTDQEPEIMVETVQPKRANGRNYEVDYRITIPQNLEIYATQVGGPVFIDSITSPVSVSLINGDIDFIEISDSTVANVINGQILGQVTLPLDGTIELSTLTGDIDCEVALPLGGTIDMTVLDGDINLDIPEDTSATFEAGVTDGIIELIQLVLHNQVRTPHSLTGRLGDGKGDIRLETGNGDIIVTGF
jgi:DUF4097 and DUF4098 domain-containing protein YvlB